MPSVNDAYADITRRIDQACANMTPNEQLTLVLRLRLEIEGREQILLQSSDK
jgi:hypothetical protein